GRATAEEYRRQRAPWEKPRFVRKVRKQRFMPFVLVDARPDVTIEIAIRAFADAKRPMDVEGQRLAGHSFSAATSLRKASARWLIACFSSGSSSPNVSSWPAGTNIGS